MTGVSQKIHASIVILGYQPEDPAMYPHLADFLFTIRQRYAEVVYIAEDDRGEGLYDFDRMVKIPSLYLRRLIGAAANGSNGAFSARQEVPPGIRDMGVLKSVCGAVNLLRKGFSGLISFLAHRRRLRRRLLGLSLSHRQCLLIAIDHTAAYCATRYFDGPIVFWSYDILAQDAPWRIKGGMLERLILRDRITSQTLMIQDESRKRLIEEALGAGFSSTIFLPVGLNDSAQAQAAARERLAAPLSKPVTVVQNGWIAQIRWSCELIEAYQVWSEEYELVFHGFMDKNDPVWMHYEAAKRKPALNTELLVCDQLSELLDRFSIGFIGYKETDRNHSYMEYASLQLVLFLRLGMPVICCASPAVSNFISSHGCGVAISNPLTAEAAITDIVRNYGRFSKAARATYDMYFNLTEMFDSRIFPAFQAIMAGHQGTGQC